MGQEQSRGAAQAVLTEVTMPAQIEVSITVGGRAVKVAADAQVDALRAPSFTLPMEQPDHGEPDQDAVKNAGMTVMSAALDALFSGSVPRATVDDQTYDTIANSQARP